MYFWFADDVIFSHNRFTAPYTKKIITRRKFSTYLPGNCLQTLPVEHCTAQIEKIHANTFHLVKRS